MFLDKEILIILSSGFGTAYRTVYSTNIDSIKKFIVSLIFSLFCGIILVHFSQEKALMPSTAILIALLVGLVSHNLAHLIMNVGNKSQDQLEDIVTEKITDVVKESINSKAKDTSPESVSPASEPEVKEAQQKRKKRKKDDNA